MWNFDQFEIAGSLEVVRVDSVQRQPTTKRNGRDECIARSRALLLGPARLRSSATRPKAIADEASNGSGSKSASACCRCACLAVRSASVRATIGPADSSASVTVVMLGTSGRHDAFSGRGSRITVLVSRIPWSFTVSDRGLRRCRDGNCQDQRVVDASNALGESPRRDHVQEEAATRQPVFLHGSP